MTLPNFNNPHYRLAGYIATAIVTLAALPLIYAMVFHTDWQFKVNWNLFSSPFFSPLFVVGIIIALVNMGRSHYSYDTIIETTDLDTGKKERHKSQDVIDKMGGSCLAPLIGHFIVEPIVYAALIYYPIAALIAFVGTFVPYILSVIVLIVCILMYKVAGWLAHLAFRSVALVTIAVILTSCFGGASWYILRAQTNAPLSPDKIKNPVSGQAAQYDATATDLTTFDLQGPVKTSTLTRDGQVINGTCGFDKQGRWITCNDQPLSTAQEDENAAVYGVVRDANQRVVQYTIGQYDMTETITINFDKQGRIEKDKTESGTSTETSLYTYDTNGRVASTRIQTTSFEMGADEAETTDVTVTYTYTDFDTHNNWRVRDVTCSNGGKYQETRHITYYE